MEGGAELGRGAGLDGLGDVPPPVVRPAAEDADGLGVERLPGVGVERADPVVELAEDGALPVLVGLLGGLLEGRDGRRGRGLGDPGSSKSEACVF